MQVFSLKMEEFPKCMTLKSLASEEKKNQKKAKISLGF